MGIDIRHMLWGQEAAADPHAWIGKHGTYTGPDGYLRVPTTADPTPPKFWSPKRSTPKKTAVRPSRPRCCGPVCPKS
jgi:hypothetical protein